MAKEFLIGEQVRLAIRPSYVKTADTMPMLRPPDVIDVGETGVVLERRPGDTWVVRFSRGAFLVDSQFLESTQPSSNTSGESIG